jgi:hypothetical protein
MDSRPLNRGNSNVATSHQPVPLITTVVPLTRVNVFVRCGFSAVQLPSSTVKDSASTNSAICESLISLPLLDPALNNAAVDAWMT